MLSGKILKAHGWPEGKVIGLAKAAAEQMEREGATQAEILARLKPVRLDPGAYLADPRLADLAREVIRRMAPLERQDDITLRERPADYAIWGAEQIEPAAISQMEQALRLPIAVAGALMPDAHPGYGLPIGGVLAAHEAVIPYAVGVDIACRMRLSVYPVSPYTLGQRAREFRRSLIEHTRFGQREGWERGDYPDHP
ncbi:MAG: RtcB family protein, partial [Ktedonobacterales bacterium]